MKRSGFTLIETVAVLITVAILAGICLTPIVITSMEMAHAQDARANLLAVYTAQLAYYDNYGTYCTGVGICDSTAHINTGLGLNIISNGWNYSCGSINQSFFCVAARSTDTNFQLTVQGGQGIILIGSGTHNPSCSYPAHPSYCANI